MHTPSPSQRKSNKRQKQNNNKNNNKIQQQQQQQQQQNTFFFQINITRWSNLLEYNQNSTFLSLFIHQYCVLPDPHAETAGRFSHLGKTRRQTKRENAGTSTQLSCTNFGEKQDGRDSSEESFEKSLPCYHYDLSQTYAKVPLKYRCKRENETYLIKL